MKDLRHEFHALEMQIENISAWSCEDCKLAILETCRKKFYCKCDGLIFTQAWRLTKNKVNFLHTICNSINDPQLRWSNHYYAIPTGLVEEAAISPASSDSAYSSLTPSPPRHYSQDPIYSASFQDNTIGEFWSKTFIWKFFSQIQESWATMEICWALHSVRCTLM